jgi:hypothetical protein
MGEATDETTPSAGWRANDDCVADVPVGLPRQDRADPPTAYDRNNRNIRRDLRHTRA